MINHILIIDDDRWFLRRTAEILQKFGYLTSVALNADEAFLELDAGLPDLILLDVLMPKLDGFAVCQKIKEKKDLREIPIIFVTATDDRDVIKKCFEVGGADYVGKPVRESELLARIELQINLKKQGQKIKEMETEHLSLKDRLLSGTIEHPEAFSTIITMNAKMQSIFKYVEVIADSTRPVLITGETGVGKELIACVIHQLSKRRGDIVTINVAGLDDNLFSDTLFGHEKGAFTGADKTRKGLIEQAAGGTLFLDEIGDLKGGSQIKLLRLLQEQEYYPLGSDERRFTDARMIVATNRDLPALMSQNEFREDLYYRLRTHQIHIPPLRERLDDLPILLDHFVRRAAEELGRKPPAIAAELLPLLERYDFPGNIREFEGMMFDAVSRTQGRTLAMETFTEMIEAAGGANMDQAQSDKDRNVEIVCAGRFPTLREIGDVLIADALEHSNNNQTLAAQLLGISRQALNKRLSRGGGRRKS